jgi:hypothetical protein
VLLLAMTLLQILLGLAATWFLISGVYLWRWHQRTKDFHACVRAGLPIPRNVGQLTPEEIRLAAEATTLRGEHRERCIRDATSHHPQVRYAASVALLANSRLDVFQRQLLILTLKRV